MNAKDRIKTALADFINTNHPVALAVEPLRADAVARAEKTAMEVVEKCRKELAEAGNDVNAVAPYPESWNSSRNTFQQGLAKYKLFASITRWRTATHSGRGPLFADIAADRAAKFIEGAMEDAANQYDAFIVKLCQKVGVAKSATIEGSHVWGYSYLTVTTEAGNQIWKTQMILNVSKLGTMFNQFPTRKVKNKN